METDPGIIFHVYGRLRVKSFQISNLKTMGKPIVARDFGIWPLNLAIFVATTLSGQDSDQFEGINGWSGIKKPILSI